MEPSGEEPELAMLDTEALAAFVNASLAKNQRLPTGRQRGTDDRPFFERELIFCLHDFRGLLKFICL